MEAAGNPLTSSDKSLEFDPNPMPARVQMNTYLYST